MLSKKTEPELPTLFLAGKLEGVSRKDAELYARGMIARHCHSTENAAFGLLKIDDGFLFEIHEGGDRRALMPALWKMLTEATVEHVVVHTATRNVELFIEDGRLVTALLPESDLAPPTDIEPGKKLKAFENDYSGFLISSVAVFCAATVLLASSLVVNALISDVKIGAVQGLSTQAADLPVMQLPLVVGPTEYIHALRYDGKRWNLQKRSEFEKPAPAQGETPTPVPGAINPAGEASK